MQPLTKAQSRKMTMIAWQGRLNEASIEDEVVRVVGEFVRALSRAELGELQEHCRPRPMQTPREVTAFALAMAHFHDGDAKSAPALHKLATFFTKAALRIYQIAERSSEVAREVRPDRRQTAGRAGSGR
ncbi:MAG TPA: hypothetical protein VFK48_15070 [Usitatibacter sp.]|nr:hypothetical protein [Usitatibacter sp.]